MRTDWGLVASLPWMVLTLMRDRRPMGTQE